MRLAGAIGAVRLTFVGSRSDHGFVGSPFVGRGFAVHGLVGSPFVGSSFMGSTISG